MSVIFVKQKNTQRLVNRSIEVLLKSYAQTKKIF